MAVHGVAAYAYVLQSTEYFKKLLIMIRKIEILRRIMIIQLHLQNFLSYSNKTNQISY